MDTSVIARDLLAARARARQLQNAAARDS